MWLIRQDEANEFFLTYDRDARPPPKGRWELVGSLIDEGIQRVINANIRNGLLVCKDDQGNVRALILEDL